MLGWNLLNRSWRLSSALLEAANNVMADNHLHSKSLVVLGAYQHLKHPSEVSKHLHIPMPTLSNIHRELERNGYLTKKVDGIDRRRHIIQVTEKGQKVFDLCTFTICKAFDEKQTTLTTKNQNSLLECIAKLLDIIDSEDQHDSRAKMSSCNKINKAEKSRVELR